MKANNLLVIIILLLISSCERSDESIMKIAPLEYFPAYPGSYWVYSNKDTIRVNENYEKCTYRSSDFTASEQHETVLLPRLSKNNIFNSAFVKEYSITNSSGLSHDSYFREILNIIEGGSFYITSSYSGHQNIGITIKTDTTIVLNGVTFENVIVTIQYDSYFAGMGKTPLECAHVREYYAKNIGLIKRESRSYPVESNFHLNFELVEYKIKN